VPLCAPILVPACCPPSPVLGPPFLRVLRASVVREQLSVGCNKSLSGKALSASISVHLRLRSGFRQQAVGWRRCIRDFSVPSPRRAEAGCVLGGSPGFLLGFGSPWRSLRLGARLLRSWVPAGAGMTPFVQQLKRENTPRARNSLFLPAPGVTRFPAVPRVQNSVTIRATRPLDRGTPRPRRARR
jgi:hypothetical protein